MQFLERKMLVFRFKFHHTLLVRVYFTICCHYSGNGLVPNRQEKLLEYIKKKQFHNAPEMKFPWNVYTLYDRRNRKEVSSYLIYLCLSNKTRESPQNLTTCYLFIPYIPGCDPKPQRVSVCVQQSILTHTSHTRLLLFPAATIRFCDRLFHGLLVQP